MIELESTMTVKRHPSFGGRRRDAIGLCEENVGRAGVSRVDVAGKQSLWFPPGRARRGCEGGGEGEERNRTEKLESRFATERVCGMRIVVAAGVWGVMAALCGGGGLKQAVVVVT